MDHALYVSMSGAIETLRAQTANAHNLANASTSGFKAELASAIPVAVEGAGQPTRVNTQLRSGQWDASAGPLQATGRSLDIGLRDDAWLAVQAPDGSEAYTRAGDLQINSVGQLLTGAGHPVLGDGGPLSVPPNASLQLGSDGTVSIVPMGQGPETQATIGRLRIVAARPDQLSRGADGLMRPTAGQALDPAPGQVLTSGVLEGSNVNLAEAMVNMISLARSFELQVKVMHATEDNAAAATTLMRMS